MGDVFVYLCNNCFWGRMKKLRHTIIEVNDHGVCDSEGKQWIHVCEGDRNHEVNYLDGAMHQIYQALSNCDESITLTFKKVSDRAWKAADKLGNEMA